MDCPETPYRREPGYAERYRDRRCRTGTGPRTHAREARAITALLQGLRQGAAGDATWLDVPSGAGRLSGLLPGSAVQVDRSLSMVQACGAGHRRLCASANRLPFTDDSFDGVLCMRLLQHIAASQERITILRELARVSRGPVLLSFFHAVSLQHLRRQVGRLLGRRSRRHAIPLGTLKDELRAAGLVPQRWWPLRRYVSEQWVVLACPRPENAGRRFR